MYIISIEYMYGMKNEIREKYIHHANKCQEYAKYSENYL